VQPLTSTAVSDSATTTQSVIPNEDRQPVVRIEEEEEDEGNGEGLGEEDQGDDDSDEFNDERDPSEDTEDDIRPQHPRWPLPLWLQMAFKGIISQCENRSLDGLPPMYTAHNFWIQPPSTYFLLQSNELSPPLLYRPHFFVWDPQALYKCLPCPNCRKVLHRHSALSRPCRVVDINTSFWLIGYRYRC
jgi:hypothetical protein